MTAKDYMWNLFQPIAEQFPIYVMEMTEDVGSTPQNYILLRPGITDVPAMHGDGTTLFRRYDCDVIAVCSGNYSGSQMEQMEAVICGILDSANISYKRYFVKSGSDSVNATYTFVYYGD